MRKIFALMVVLSAVMSGTATAGLVDFNMVVDASHATTLTYAGGSNPFVGVDIPVQTIVSSGTPLNPGASLVLNGRFDFTTGGYTGSSGTDWNFSPGGTFSITNSSSTSIAGTFIGDTRIIDLGAGSFKVFGAAIIGSLNSDIAAYYGLPTALSSPVLGGIALLFSTNSLPGGLIGNTQFASGNLAITTTDSSTGLTSTPEPTTMATCLIGLAAGGFCFMRNRRKAA